VEEACIDDNEILDQFAWNINLRVRTVVRRVN
jgi:hypothetical protein